MDYKINQNIVEIPFINKLDSQREFIKSLLKLPGRYLIEAGAGEGKTYTILRIVAT